MTETEMEVARGRALGLTDEEIMYLVDYSSEMANATACQRAIDNLENMDNKAPLNALVDAYAMYYHVAQQAQEKLCEMGYTETEIMALACKILG